MKTGTYIKKMPLELQKGDAVFVMSSLLTFSHIEEREQMPCGVPKNSTKPAQNSAQRNTKTQTSATKSDNPRKGFDPVGITSTARIALTSNVVRALL